MIQYDINFELFDLNSFFCGKYILADLFYILL